MTTCDEYSSVKSSIEFLAMESDWKEDSDAMNKEASEAFTRATSSDTEKLDSRETETEGRSGDSGSEVSSTDVPESDEPNSRDTPKLDPIKVTPSFLPKGPPPGFEAQPLRQHSAELSQAAKQLSQAAELQQLMDEVAMLEQQLASFSDLMAKQAQQPATTEQATAGRTSLRSLRSNAKMFVPMQPPSWDDWTTPAMFPAAGLSSGYSLDAAASRLPPGLS